ncbi:MAG: alkaline phosphatase [Saprospiraceae bacterium]|jgi:alkaline phosphatase|nr:alkaline phosphatase [Saprospiraceae bacterium]MDP5048064.1 alkaline phosphatase [Saprospiraceae bacterium]
MYSLLKISFAFTFLLLLVGCKSNTSISYDLDEKGKEFQDYPTNIILLIGDGMGLTQISAAMYSNNNRLALAKFPVIGFHKSHAANELITDSAAGGTAIACGIKTNNGNIGTDENGLPTLSILEELDSINYSTGMIVTSSIVHATPAAFAAHRARREMYEEIALDYLDANVDLLIGGGRQYFQNREMDDRDLVNEFENKGYVVMDQLYTTMNKIKWPLDKNLLYFTADKQPLTVSGGRNYLSFAVRQGVQYLEQKSNKGFFLLVEGSQIDWMNHANDGRGVVMETLDFDRAIWEAIQYANKKGNTLVLVTADHESGGMSIEAESRMNKLKYGFTTNGHTAAMIPVFAYGPGSNLFRGIYENTSIYHKMRTVLGLKERINPLSPNPSSE